MNRLRELRQKKGDTQEDVAKAMGVTRRGYQKWENEESQIKPDKAQHLADYFGVSVGYLLNYTDDIKKYDDEKVRSDLDGHIWVYSEQRNKEKDFQTFINCLKELQVIISDDQAKSVFNLIQSMNLSNEGNYWGDFVSYDLMFSRSVNEIYNDLSQNGYSLLVDDTSKENPNP